MCWLDTISTIGTVTYNFKMLLVRIVENNKIDDYSRAG